MTWHRHAACRGMNPDLFYGADREDGQSLKSGDALYRSIDVVDEHLARRVLAGTVSCVLDCVVKFVEPAEILTTAPT